MSQVKQNENKKSRFLLHYVFAELKDEAQETADKLVEILQRRHPNDTFVQSMNCTYDVPLELCSKILFIGLGTASLKAYQMQQLPNYKGVSLFAVCPPPGISLEPKGGPRVVLYGSKDGTYGTSCLPDKGNKEVDFISVQMYGLPSLIHGLKLAPLCVAYLIGQYMKSEDLTKAVFDASGDEHFQPAKLER